MSAPRDHDTILRRWNWTGWGYEEGFPRGCGFTDVDAATEFDGRRLLIETKHYEHGDFKPLDRGQELFYKNELRVKGTTVLVLYGDETQNEPLAVFDLALGQLFDWRGLSTEQRRAKLKNHINRAMNLPIAPVMGPPMDPRCISGCGDPATTPDGYCEECRPF